MLGRIRGGPGFRIWLSCLLLGLAGTGSGPGAVFGQEVENPARRAAREGDTLARIGDQVITVDQLRAEIEELAPRDPALQTPEGRRSLLEDMIRHRALVTRALAAGYAEHPELVAAWERLLVSFYQRETWNRRLEEITVTDAEIEAHYATHRDDYALPARYRAAIVFYEIPPGTPPETRAEIEARAHRALEEAAALDPSVLHFGPLARRDSAHRASRYQGGVIGWLSPALAGRSRWEPELLDAVFALGEPGELAPPVRTEQGLYLVRLVALEPSRIQPLGRVRDGIRQRLLQDQRAELRRTFDRELAAELDISIDHEKLRAIEPPTGGPELSPPAVPEIAAASPTSGRQHP